MSAIAWFLVGSAGAAVVLAWFALMFWLIEDDRLLTAGAVVVVTVGIITTAIYFAQRNDGAPGETESWKGGQGPATVCWYEDRDNPDTVIMAGKTPVPVDGGTSTYTVCSKTKAAER